jgi:hypothetical protein
MVRQFVGLWIGSLLLTCACWFVLNEFMLALFGVGVILLFSLPLYAIFGEDNVFTRN